MTRRCSSSGRVKPSSGGALAGSRSWSAKTCGTYLRELITEADNCTAAVQFVAVAPPPRSAAGPETRRVVQSEKFARRDVNRPEAQTALTGLGWTCRRTTGRGHPVKLQQPKHIGISYGAGPILIFRVQTGRLTVLCPHRQQSQSSRILLVIATSTQPCSQPCTTRTQPCKCPSKGEAESRGIL